MQRNQFYTWQVQLKRELEKVKEEGDISEKEAALSTCHIPDLTIAPAIAVHCEFTRNVVTGTDAVQ